MHKRSTATVLALTVGLTLLVATPATAQHTVTPLFVSGSAGDKIDLVIVGDGFQAGNGQDDFNAWVQDRIVENVFGQGRFFGEQANAFNLYRINAVSQDSGVTTVTDSICPVCGAVQAWGAQDDVYPCDDQCMVCNNGTLMVPRILAGDNRTTALDIRRTGDWCRCWLESGPNHAAGYAATVGALVPGADVVIMVANTNQGGGCGGGGRVWVTLATDAVTVEHELGHALGGLTDEYWDSGDGVNTVRPGGEPAALNVTATLNPIKWSQFVDPAEALPTVSWGAGGTGDTVGAFEGARYCDSGLYRPRQECMMRSQDEFCPVCHHTLKEILEPKDEFDYLRSYRGDFDGDGNGDVLIHFENTVLIYRSNGTQLELMANHTGTIGSCGSIGPNDRYFVANWDGDADDDLYMVNIVDWSKPYFHVIDSQGDQGLSCRRVYHQELPNWDDMKPNDQFFVADFNGDGNDDVYVFNYGDWSRGYLAMLQADGNGELVNVRNYIEELPNWDDMLGGDEFYVGDFDADGRDDLYVFNYGDWSMGYLGMLRSTGNGLEMVRRYDDVLPGWDSLLNDDQLFVGDFDRDDREDLYIFNGHDWGPVYLGMFRSTGGGLQQVELYGDTIPGWGWMGPNDRWAVADVNNDQRSEVYVFNATDWDGGGFLGMLVTDGAGLDGELYSHRLGSWAMGRDDLMLVSDHEGNGREDLILRNADWLGVFHSNGAHLMQTRIYPRWIHNVDYHDHGWW